MQCDDVDIELPASRVSELDRALNELGMLATCTNSRQEFLRERHNKNVLNMLTINTRYVSNVSIGFQVRPTAPHVRYKPYALPRREERYERTRTRSENNDGNTTGLIKAMLEERIHQSIEDLTQLKKAKSLESIACENGQNVDVKSINLGNGSELEVVSNCIQNLKVAE